MDDFATPALVVDHATVARNLARMAAYTAAHHLGLRPHTKTHKSRLLAGWQLDAGAIGLTVAKAGEAEVMVEASRDLLLAFPAVDKARCDRLALVARNATLRVAIDSSYAAEALSAAAGAAGTTIGILVDLDVGMGRTGVASPAAALELAQCVAQTPGLRLDGLLCYPGQISVAAAEQAPALGQVASLLAETLDLLRRAGLEAKIVSGGSTPTAYQSHFVPQYTEIRPGTYIFNDLNTLRGGFCRLEDCAATIVSTVVSTAVAGQVVIDAGSKTLTSDRCGPAPESGYGMLPDYPAARVVKLSEEHGQVDVRDCSRVPKLGERLTVIPNHICPCVNLQDSLWLREPNGRLEPLCVDARGRLS